MSLQFVRVNLFQRLHGSLFVNSSKFYSAYQKLYTKSEERKVKKSLAFLGLPCDDITAHTTRDVKAVYVELVKCYHPDSASSQADRAKFEELQQNHDFLAGFYQRLEAHNDTSTRTKSSEDDTQDYKPYQSPQHRKYLSFDGKGYGSPAERRRQYDQWRADQAAERVFEFRRDSLLRMSEGKELVPKDSEHKFTKKIRTSNLILRLADDLIKESIAKGDFDNLPGSGKPLKSSSDANPYVDSHTHHINNILISNGFSPQWMTLETEIRGTYKKLREQLVDTYTKYGQSTKRWTEEVERFRTEIQKLNEKVDSLNMMVPLLKMQMMHYRPEFTIRQITEADSKPTSTSQ